jgi:DNA primase
VHEYDTPEFMAKVLKAYDIDYTEQKVMCPFHGDVNPSMSIDLAKSRVYCFGCQKSYTAFQFVEAAEPELNKLQIYSRLASIAKGAKIELKPQHIRDNSEEDFAQLLTQAEDYYFNLPKTDWVNGDWTDELDYLVERGFSQELLNKCGAKLNFNAWYPIIFPIMDNGVFKGWVCRTTQKEIEARRKYLYNTGFRRSTCLCGRYNNKSPLLIVEGYMDMLKLRQAGLKNVAATLGWKMSPEQRQKLREAGVLDIVSALDNDESGEKGHKFLLTQGFRTVQRWKFRKTHKDPGDQSPSEIIKVAKFMNLSIDKGFDL